MTDHTWNPDDYRFEFPDVPRYEGELVDMPIHHKVEKVRRFLIEGVLSEIERCINSGAELAGLLLSLATVDYLAGYYVGRQTTRHDYINFMIRYFPAKYHPYLEDIYIQLRSGLMHNLVAANPWRHESASFLIHPREEHHLDFNEHGKLIFSVAHFRIDIYRAWRMHAHDIIMKAEANPQLVNNFNARFDRLKGVSAFMERVPD